MFPHHPNRNNFDVQFQSINVKVPGQNVYRVPRQESSSHGFPQCQLPRQSSLQGPSAQQLGGMGRGTVFSDPKLSRQQQEVHRQCIQHQHSQDLDHCREQNMKPASRADFPETSYSALLHGPDTPPSHPETTWIIPVEEVKNSDTTEGSRWPLKAVTGTPRELFMEEAQGLLYGSQDRPAASGTQHGLQDQPKNKPNVPSRPCSEVPYMSDVENERNQVHLTSDTGSKVKVISDSGLSQWRGSNQTWDGQIQCSFCSSEATNIAVTRSGQSVSQQQQHVINMHLERRDGNYNQLQSQGGPRGDKTFKQQANKVFPYGEMPNGSTLNAIDLQQYNAWNALQTPSMNRTYENHLQHPADTNYNGWGMNAWQEGHFMEQTSCLPYTSGSMNMAPSHAQYGWQTQSAATLADGFSQFYPEGYYASGSTCSRQELSFGGVGETIAFPSPFESYGHYQVYHTPPNQFVAGVGIQVDGAGWNELSGPQDVPRQEHQERIVHAGGHVQPEQLECSRIKGSFVSHPANKLLKSGQEMTLESVLDGIADTGSSFQEKDVDFEGPQVKKKREFCEINVGACHKSNYQSSIKFPAQPTSEEFNRPFQRSGLPQRELVPGTRFVPSVEHSQEHPTINDYFPRGSFGEESFSAGKNLNQTGGQAQVANSTSSKSSVYLQSTASVGMENTFSETGMPSYVATQELSEPQCTGMKSVGGPGSVFISNTRNQDVKDEQNGFANLCHDYSFTVNGGERVIPYFHTEVQEQLPLYPAHPSQLQTQVQMPEMNEFAYLKAGPSEINAQFRGFSRPALGKFYPPPPFQSHPLHPQRETAMRTNTFSNDQTLHEAWAPKIFESAGLASEMKELARKPVNNQSNSEFLEKGMFYHPAGDESITMSKSMCLTESEWIHQQSLLSSEGGNVSKQHSDNSLYARTQSTDQIVAKNIVKVTHSKSMMVESQGSAGPVRRLVDNEQLRASQPSPCTGTLVSGRNLVNVMQMDGDQQQPGPNSDHLNVGVEYSALRDGEPTRSSKVGSEKISQHQFLPSKPNLRPQAALHPKKRKKPVPYLIPWRIVATQPRGQLPSISKTEMMWASAANRLPEKDGGDGPSIGIYRAESRLRLTTQLMQQILSPLPSVLMHGNQPFDLECGVYNLAKSALGEACRLMAGAERETEPPRKGTDAKTMALHGPTRMWNLAKEVAMMRLVERFMERIKRLNFELARLDCSMSVLELKGKSYDLEKLAIVHRLGRHHGTDFTVDFSENRLVEGIPNCGPGIRGLSPQKYVIAVPMPRTLPEGVRCLSL